MSEALASTAVTYKQLITVLDSVSDGVCLMDRNLVITGFNRAAEQLTGFNRDEAIGRRCCDVFQDCRSNSVSGCLAALSFRTGQAVTDPELRIRDRAGAEKRVCLSMSALLSEAGEITGGVITFRKPPATFNTPVRRHATADDAPPAAGETALPLLEASERRTIEAVLRRHGGSRAAAGRELCISRTTLWRKMRKFKIEPT